MKKLVGFFKSLKLTVVLLSSSMVLVFAGTLAQVDQGIWTVVDQYFRCLVAWVDLPIFFPQNWDVPEWRLPFPGGFLVGGLLVLNLLVQYGSTLKLQVTGKRKMIGFVALFLGVLITFGVMMGWGTESVAATQNDAFWRVFWRLGRGTLAAVVLYLACWLLFRKRGGIVLLHGGILFLLIGEFATALYAVEGSMTIKEGETVGYIDHTQQLELSFTETTDFDHDTVTVFPQKKLKTDCTLDVKGLPFTVKIKHYFVNSNRPLPISSASDAMQKNYPTYKGYGERLYVAEQPEASGSRVRNAPSVDIELFDRQSGASLGRYILSLWFYPNFVQRAWDMPTEIRVGERTFEVYLRYRREYLVSPSGHPFSIKLLDFVHETYEGTQTPKDFSSRILLRNPSEKIERELRIWMNNPLRYARRTFYQSGYLPDNSGTVLQVVRNDTWMIPYLACMIVFVGMTAQFVQTLRRSQQRNDLQEK
jgi:hypothetical protein